MWRKVFVFIIVAVFMTCSAYVQISSSLNSDKVKWTVKAAEDHKDIFNKRYNGRRWVTAVVLGTVYKLQVSDDGEK